MSNFDSTYSAIASITDGKYDSTYSALKAAAVSMGAEDKDYDSEYSVAVALAEVAGNGGGSGGGSSKPIIYNGFKFTGGDMSLVDFSQYDWSGVYDGSYFFSSSRSLQQTINKNYNSTDDWSNFEKNFNGKFISTSKMFYSMSDGKFTSIPQMDTSEVVDMNGMFSGCNKITSIPQMDTSNVTDMGSMFSGCNKITSIPQMDTSNVTNMGSMFSDCKSLISIPQMDTSNVTNMGYMFYRCSSLTSIPQMDTSNVTFMNDMFSGCNKITSIPQMDISNVTNMSNVFMGCKSLIEVRFKGDPNKVTKTTGMFSEVVTNGTLYYDSRYDYSVIISVLPSTWTAIPYDVVD